MQTPEPSKGAPILKSHEVKALHELLERLQALYGARLNQTILFGSKARGDSTEGSDLDILAVIDDLPNHREARNQILHETTPIDLRHDVFLSVFAVDADYFRKAGSIPFYANVKAEGIRL
jgi:uncharacterized protein